MPKPGIKEQVVRSVRDALRRSGLRRGARVVVAVSGGQDSMALLYALQDVAAESDLELHAAHLNHGLRGADSDGDADFVQRSCEGLDISCTVGREDVSAFRRSEKLSLEEAGRRMRYQFLARVARQRGADCAAVGHTSDDQAETVLMHLVRGSGLAGLRGMDYMSQLKLPGVELKLLRPLLGVSRRETGAFCDELGIQPRLDRSNQSTRFIRNRLRLEALPELERINPAVKDSLVRLSRSVSRDYSYLEDLTDGLLDTAATVEEGVVRLRRPGFEDMHPSMQHNLVRRAYLLARGELTDLEEGHVEEMVRLMGVRPGVSMDLPGGLQFLVCYDEAFIGDPDRMPCPLPPLHGGSSLKTPGASRFGDWLVNVTVVQGDDLAGTPQGPVGESGLVLTHRMAVPEGGLLVRTREPGDRFQPLGMGGTKKLQDFMVDAKIPRRWRDRVPLVVTPRGIAWVTGWRIADWARVPVDATEALEVEFRLDPR